MMTSVMTSDMHSKSRDFRDLEHGSHPRNTAATVSCPDAETSSEIHSFIHKLKPSCKITMQL
jgi:hypothetical protein